MRFASYVLPPVANMNPNPETSVTAGRRMFIDARPSVPMKFEMNSPSMMLYDEMNSMVRWTGA